MAKRARHTLREVAERAGVSAGTASRVFANNPSVSIEMRDAVHQAALDLDYEPRRRNNNGALFNNAIFGVVTRDGSGFSTTNPFYCHVLNGVQRAAADSSIGLMYETVPESGPQAWRSPQFMDPAIVHGVVIMGYASAIFVQQLQASGVPAVVLDHWFEDLELDSVCNDDERGARMLTRRLIDLGHRDPPPAVIAGPLEHASLRRRLLGYQHTVRETGMSYDERYIRLGTLNAAGGYEQANVLMEMAVPPTAIFCFNDLMAMGALNALRERGLEVPRDVAIVGYDDIDLAAHASPPLTTVRVDKELIGMQGVWHLIERIRHPEIAPRETRLPVHLVERESSRRP